MRELVIDVSHCDPDIDIGEWKDERGIWAVIAKCGGYEVLKRNRDPEEFRTRTFERQYGDAVANGLHVGAYYYSVATDEDTMRHNADHCASLLGGKSFDMPIYLDVEDPGQFELSRRELTDVILAFIHRMEEHGYVAGLYTGRSAINGCMYGEELEPYPLWIAEYSDRCRTSLSHGMWQFGCMRLEDGDVSWDDEDGYVDCNWCYIDYPGNIRKDRDNQPTGQDDLRQQIVDAARSQLGDPYYSLNYSAEEGFGGVGTHYVGEGWGCAESVSYDFNIVLGTRYGGSTWMFYGDALGDEQYNHSQGGDFFFVDEPLPGDVVCYIAQGHDGEDAEDCSHVALYIGDDMVIGSWGKSMPSKPDYVPGRGVSEDHISEQSLGNGWRFIRCVRLSNTDGGSGISDQALDVDGYCGRLSVREWQRQLGTYVDGVISGQDVDYDEYRRNVVSVTDDGGGSQLVCAVQRRVGASVDGIWGPETSRRVQEWLIDHEYDCGPAGADGYFGYDSVCALQRSLNDGAWS